VPVRPASGALLVRVGPRQDLGEVDDGAPHDVASHEACQENCRIRLGVAARESRG
jgi:hypothetical protein